MKENKMGAAAGIRYGFGQSGIAAQNEYLVAENRILRSHLPSRLRLSDPQRSTLAEISKGLGRQALAKVALAAKPDTILGWYRKLIAHKFDGSKHLSYPGRPEVEAKLEALIVQMAKENSDWGYYRIVGALANVGYDVSHQPGGKCLEAAWYRTGAEAKPEHELERLHSIAYGGLGWNRFLYCRSAELARFGDILRLVLHSPGESPCQLGWDHTTS